MFATSSGADGARLYYETHGVGPDLVLIAGAGGSAASFAGVVPFLRDRFRVIAYDRRGLNRSTGRESHDGTMAQQADDLRAVLDAAGAERPVVFGTCGGASIAFEFGARHPERLAALLAHEPITVRVLPDADDQLAYFRDMCELNTREGPVPAMMAWMTYQGRDFALKIRPTFLERTVTDGDFVFRHDIMRMVSYLPDVPALAGRVPIRLVVGTGSRAGGYSYARTVPALAELLRCEVADVPGHHTSYIYRPEAFGPAVAAQALAVVERPGVGG
ncbi:alpha/beta hydrolase [Micromonospora sp. NPDC049559]|uniref:alpha/beta fold hydrolase n=1 Tax=Micromonospora sp. NPDC049559 TaxID=3155923 RepID=UPI0034135EF8